MQQRLLKSPKFFTKNITLTLNKCLKHKTLKPCKQIHALILTKPLNPNYWSLTSKLIATYASCGDLSSSKTLFHKTPNPNSFAFNWMILTSTFSGFHHQAIVYFLSMFRVNETISPNEHTFSTILKCCVGVLDVGLGNQVYGMVWKMGFVNFVMVRNSLVDMYGKCGVIKFGRQVFDEMCERDVVSWTVLISRYADSGEMREAVALFERMGLEGVERNVFTWNAVISGYAKIGDCDGAFKYFDRMGKEGLRPDLATWNAMICGFVQSEKGFEGLELLRDMMFGGSGNGNGIRPNGVTVTGVLPACGMIGSIGKGREIHGLVYRMGIDVNVFVGSALIDMYSKCGSVGKARSVFDGIRDKNVASWNAMIGCYGKHGMVDSGIELFEMMMDGEVKPNEVTLTSVLSACSHGGLVDKGLEIFRSIDSYGVKANEVHYTCLIDLLCRVGRMDEAYDIVQRVGQEEVREGSVAAFLNGCKIHDRIDLAEKISEYLKMELKSPGEFVTLSNIYASEGKWGGVEDVRAVMKVKRVHRTPGFSSA